MLLKVYLQVIMNGIIATGLFENEHWTGFYPGINWYWGLGAHIGFWGSRR